MTDLTDFNHALQRCAAAYHHVRAELPEGAYYHADLHNQQKASLAFLAQLPVLIDPASCQLYVACVAQGVAIGAVDICDAGRLCHLAQTAMSIWKLANLTIPAAEEKRQREAEKAEREARKQATPHPSKGNQADPANSAGNQTPLPPKGNQSLEWALQDALDNLPLFEVQKDYFQFLRNRGIILPCDAELRQSPLAALHFCRTAEQIQRKELLDEIARDAKKAPEPAKAQPDQPTKAA
jgi:hypothetical protein